MGTGNPPAETGHRISVIIPVKNEQEKIKKCLRGVFSQTVSPAEVIVVDGGSTDNTIESIGRFDVKLLSESYSTVGGARQTGLEAAAGEYIAYTDADCVPDPGWLEGLVKGLGEGIVGVGGSVVNMGNGTWEESISLALNTFLGGARSVQERVYPDRRFVLSISGCNCLYRKHDLERAGGFDTSLKVNEDTIINKKLRAYGSILYVPEAVVRHYQNRGLRQFARRMFSFGYGRGKNRLVDLQVVPPVLAAAAIALLPLYYPLSLAMLLLYMATVVLFTALVLSKSKKWIYCGSVPVAFVTEHACYAAGFWTGLASSLLRPK
jgi:glycosyltransferase involved in cell wall biosynthesis